MDAQIDCPWRIGFRKQRSICSPGRHTLPSCVLTCCGGMGHTMKSDPVPHFLAQLGLVFLHLQTERLWFVYMPPGAFSQC